MGGGGNVSIISAATETVKKYKDIKMRRTGKIYEISNCDSQKVILSRVLVKYFNLDHLIQESKF